MQRKNLLRYTSLSVPTLRTRRSVCTRCSCFSRPDLIAYSGVKPFPLHLLPRHESHLCPVRAWSRWICITKLRSGLLFRTVTKNDCVTEKPLVSAHLEECPKVFPNLCYQSIRQYIYTLRQSLLDVLMDPLRFGSHSSRQGGIYYYFSVKRKTIAEICEWAGSASTAEARAIWRHIVRLIKETQNRSPGRFMVSGEELGGCRTCGT